jgi:tRNA dimethylallyltransferase
MQSMILIAGPTGVGKSVIAARLAAALGAEVVNADSMQVYGDLRILTARPTAELLALARHHLYGFVDATNEYGLANWLDAAAKTINTLLNRRCPVILVGGTGLYLSALERGYGPVRRFRYAAEREEVAKLPPGWSLRGGYATSPPSKSRGINYINSAKLVRVVLERPRQHLYDCINRNFATMARVGAVDEVATLLQRNLHPNRPIMKALGVRELASFIKGEIELDEAIDLGQRNSRKFARRQITWFRNQMADWRFVCADTAVDTIVDLYNEK